MGKPTWVKTMTAYVWEESTVAEKALHVARAKIGQKEVGWNAGPFVMAILASVGLTKPAAWCASFVSFCLAWAGGKSVGPRFHRYRVRAWRDWGKSQGRISRHPSRGNLMYWLNVDGTGHIGFVAEVDGRTIRTIEGNTNAQGARDGNGVWERWRTLAELEGKQEYGFIDIRVTTEETSDV